MESSICKREGVVRGNGGGQARRIDEAVSYGAGELPGSRVVWLAAIDHHI